MQSSKADGSQDKVKRRQIYFCIFIALWTIIQSGFHLYGLFLLAWWRKCIQTTHMDWDLYTTYLIDFIDISAECPNVTLNISDFDADDVRMIVTKLVDNSTPDNLTNDSLDAFITAYIILDVLWIVASVALFMGSCCRIKEFWALVFYLPWVVLNVMILLYDAFCAIYFGLRIPNTGTFADWLNFISVTAGFSDVKAFGEDLSSLVTGAASIMMTFISARGGVIWFINLFLMIYVIKIALGAYREKFKDEQRRTKRHRRNPLVYSASVRIRNWYMFYGSLDRDAAKRKNDDDDFGAKLEKTNADCDEEVATSSRKDLHLGVLANQLPWSYVNEEAMKSIDLGGAKFDLEGSDDETVSRF